jgi:hypothetical protein
MGPGTGRPSWVAVAMTVLVALGVCTMFAAVSATSLVGGISGWTLCVVGAFVTVGALAVLWRVQGRRDRHLR